MSTLIRCTILVIVSLLADGHFYDGFADDKQQKNPHRHQGRSHNVDDDNGGHASKTRLKPVANQTYKETCGACHFAYQPGLLPSGSWGKVLSNLKDHFGETVDIDAESKTTIEKYLMENSAEHSKAKCSVKILRSLEGQIPSRITEIPIFRDKHHDISAEVFTRKAVGSLRNCSACHRTADQGVYKDDHVLIPK
ncbi:MAG: diheme cytochrome c [Desulfomonile sp.]